MQSDVVVQVNQLSKKFCRSLKRSMLYGAGDVCRNLLGFRSHSDQLRTKEFWSVEDVSFSLKRGECLGLIGPNGAGKSTLLKLLNGIIIPDRGEIRMKGRVAALIEVGAGFHPMLTGRENIYINGSILGLSKKEIDRQFDSIVAFSELEEFLDTPVKNYSSGMHVRLGFSVAAHLNPDILLVDEVLAVGDIAFRAKCRQRIQELIENGTAIIFVSHDMHTVSYVCPRAIVMMKGKVQYEGVTPTAIDVYRENAQTRGAQLTAGTGEIRITNVEKLNNRDEKQEGIGVGDFIKLRIHYRTSEQIDNPIFNIIIMEANGKQVSGIRNDYDAQQIPSISNDGYVDIMIDHFNLLPDMYSVDLVIFHSDGFSFYDRVENAIQIKVNGGRQINGTTYLPHSWGWDQ
ncbi:MAG: ABC transporter ATP-binding protein [Phycisphaerae bacterium]|nr:ABC transporter ATP-binding protein [Phycisphaerae bacterium]